MSETYIPSPGTVVWRVIDFLQRNDGEELSKADIAAKFDCAVDGVDTLLARAMRAGYINKARSDGVTVWRLGVTQVQLPQAAAGVQRIERPRAALRTSKVGLDLDAVEVRKGVPLRTPQQERREAFDELLRKLEIGDSAVFGAHGVGEMKHHAKRFGSGSRPQRRFTVVALGDGVAGIERLA